MVLFQLTCYMAASMRVLASRAGAAYARSKRRLEYLGMVERQAEPIINQKMKAPRGSVNIGEEGVFARSNVKAASASSAAR